MGDGASATTSASDGHGRILEKHKDFPLRLWSLEMSKTLFDVEYVKWAGGSQMLKNSFRCEGTGTPVLCLDPYVDIKYI